MDSLKEIWESLSERFKNPLLYAFATSWSIINYKIILTIIGDGEYKEKIAYIDSYIHPQNSSNSANLLIIPAACAIAYVFILPIISLATTFTTARYERWHSTIKINESKKGILTKEQRAKLEDEIEELHKKLREELHEKEEKLKEINNKMSIYVKEISRITGPAIFENLKIAATKWTDAIKPEHSRTIQGTEDQKNLVQKYGIPKEWAKVFEILRKPEGVYPDEIKRALSIKNEEALEILINLAALNMLDAHWNNGELYFKLIESSWVALLNGRPA